MCKLMLSLAFLALASAAGANGFTADGTLFEPAHGYRFLASRWLVPDGGFCGGIASCSTTISKDISFQPVFGVSWYWMAYVNDAVMHVYVTVDGVIQ